MSLFPRSSLALLISMSLIGTAQAVELDTVEKQYSYAEGIEYMHRMERRGITLDIDAFNAAVNDVVQGNSIRMSREERNAAARAFHEKKVKQKQGKNKLEASKIYLENNKNNPGVVVLPSGLQYIEHRAGEGESPKPESKVRVRYLGTLIDGSEFDSSFNNPEQLAIFQLDGMTSGFIEALTLMKPGAKWSIFIPPDLAYGTAGSGEKIGPNETLIYDVELISVE